ncbi:MAG TPA: N-acetylmuramoyl-L-alanine amidase [Candidatus Anoxymicrobiaceae bacterium]
MVIKIADDGSFEDELRNEQLNRTSMRLERQARRRRIRNTLLLVGVVALMGAVAATIVMVLTMNSGGLNAPKLVGMKFADAKKQVESLGLFVEIDSMQDSSGDCSKLKVEVQDPKPGTDMEKNETMMVRLKGLHESPEFTGRTSKPTALATSPDAGSNEPGATDTQPAAPAQQQPASTGVVICLDPGHSGRDGNEVDSATGLNVGDNGGCTGELQNMWDLAQKTKAALEQAGFTVRLTKGSAGAYASLRTRADIGNACSAVVRLHYDDTGYTGVMRPPANGARCPSSDTSHVTVVDGGVASASDELARAIAPGLGLSVKDDTGGTSQGNSTPAGHPTALIGSVLSTVPVVCIENNMSRVKDSPSGQDEVARQIAAGVTAYFHSR